MKLRLIVAATAIAALPGLAFAAPGDPGTGIVSSPHDFSQPTAATWSGGELCTVCHTPHNSIETEAANAPLWNHTLTGVTFAPYTGYEIDATDIAQPGGVSKLCLSCHDGTTALNAFGGATTTGTETMFTYDSLGEGENVPHAVGRDGNLADDHPISFTYDTALATLDGGLHDPAVAGSWDGTESIADGALFGDKIECASCHDVHNKDSVADYLLVKDIAGGALCLTCHDK